MPDADKDKPNLCKDEPMSAGPRTIARAPYCLPGDALHHHFPSSFFIHPPLKSGVLLSRLLLFAFHCYRARTNTLPLLGADLRRAFHRHPGAQPSSVHQQQPPPPTFAHIMLLWLSGSLCSPLSLTLLSKVVWRNLLPVDPQTSGARVPRHPEQDPDPKSSTSQKRIEGQTGSGIWIHPQVNQGVVPQRGHTEVTGDVLVLLVLGE